MPIFEFRCKKCNYMFEEFVFSSNYELDNIACPACGEQKSEKLMSSFSSSGGNSVSGFAGAGSSCGSGGFG